MIDASALTPAAPAFASMPFLMMLLYRRFVTLPDSAGCRLPLLIRRCHVTPEMPAAILLIRRLTISPDVLRRFAFAACLRRLSMLREERMWLVNNAFIFSLLPCLII